MVFHHGFSSFCFNFGFGIDVARLKAQCLALRTLGPTHRGFCSVEAVLKTQGSSIFGIILADFRFYLRG